MRAASLLAARGALVAGPVVIAFFAGGFFDGPRYVGLIVAAVTLTVLAVAGAPFPRHPAARVAIGAAFAYAAWIALSATWAPVTKYALSDANRAVLYAAVLLAAALAFSTRAAVRALEPLAALGTAIVVGYGVLGRLLPGIVVEHPQRSALGRLDQPLTYWNAVGALAALGLVLCARIAGDAERPRAMRAGALAATVPLGMGCYLSFSRGALAALAAGLIAVVLLAPTRCQLRAALTALAAGALAALAAGLSPAVRAIDGSLATREREGAIVLAITVVLMALAAATTVLTTGDRPLPLTRPLRIAGVAAIVALFVLPIVVAGGKQQAPPATGATNARFSTLGSNRYGYWRIALRTGEHHALAGVGASGFRVAWLRERTNDELVRDAHSLELETFAELGLVGLLLLGALLGSTGVAAAAAHRADPALAAGPAAALTVWLLHSALDWDWEMPGLTLAAVVLAGALLARAERAPELGEQRALAPQDERAEDDAEQRGLEQRLPQRPRPAPER